MQLSLNEVSKVHVIDVVSVLVFRELTEHSPDAGRSDEVVMLHVRPVNVLILRNRSCFGSNYTGGLLKSTCCQSVWRSEQSCLEPPLSLVIERRSRLFKA